LKSEKEEGLGVRGASRERLRRGAVHAPQKKQKPLFLAGGGMDAKRQSGYDLVGRGTEIECLGN